MVNLPTKRVNPDERMFAHSIDDISRKTRIGRTSIFKAIADGKLRARKYGRRTIITDADLQAFLAALPAVEPRTSRGAY